MVRPPFFSCIKGGTYMTINDLLEIVKDYNPDEVDKVKRAYEYAAEMHKGQYRQSGEPYIIHPLNVAYMLAEVHADGDSVCAGLLHDTLEDTEATKEEIAELFGKDVANLVDGVTKLTRIGFSSKEEQNLANIRKLMMYFTIDIRSITIKLFDNLHNMRTLDYKSEFKQRENAIETMELYVPIADRLGTHRIKTELEDIAFKHIDPKMYGEIEERRQKIGADAQPYLDEMVTKIKGLLDEKNIPNEIRVRIKNIYGIYKSLRKGNKISNIHDLLAIKVIVDEVENCYRTLHLIHKEYHPINDKFKDYIANPKTNKYSSLHTTVFGPGDTLVQTQIRTAYMDKIATYGLTAYWDIYKGGAKAAMQNDLRENFQFFTTLSEMNEMAYDNQEYVRQVKSEIFADKIYVYTTTGEIIELPKGATPVDFAYRLSTDIGNTMVAAIVNNEYVPINYELKTKDRVRIVTDELAFGPRMDWINIATTSCAKRKIKEFSPR